MKGKKKKKRYFCDWWEKVTNKESAFVTLFTFITIITLGGSCFAVKCYLSGQEEYKALLDNYSDPLYDELEENVVNHINTRKTIDEVALHEIADTHSSSYDGEVTVLECSKKNSDGFEARITVGMSKDGKILWTERQFKMKEEYVEDIESGIVVDRYPHVVFIFTASIVLSIYALICVGEKVSKKHKKRDEVRKAKNRTGFEQ